MMPGSSDAIASRPASGPRPSPAGTTSCTSPIRSASAAPNSSAVSRKRIAWPQPSCAGTRKVAPPNGTIPRPIFSWRKRTRSATDFTGPIGGNDADPGRLASACWALALLTEMFRNPMVAIRGPLERFQGHRASPGELLGLASPAAVGQLAAFREVFASTLLPQVIGYALLDFIRTVTCSSPSVLRSSYAPNPPGTGHVPAVCRIEIAHRERTSEMPNVNVTYAEMQSAARQLQAGEQTIEGDLSKLKRLVDNLVAAGYVTDASSRQFEASYTQFNTGATKMVQGLNGMGQYLDAAVKAFHETDTQLAASLKQ